MSLSYFIIFLFLLKYSSLQTTARLKHNEGPSSLGGNTRRPLFTLKIAKKNQQQQQQEQQQEQQQLQQQQQQQLGGESRFLSQTAQRLIDVLRWLIATFPTPGLLICRRTQPKP